LAYINTQGEKLNTNEHEEETMKPVAVIGAGSSGFAATAHLLSQRVPVHLWNRPKEGFFENIRREGGIRVEGMISGRFLPQIMTYDIEEAISDVDLIYVTVPAHAHAAVSAAMMPYLRPNHVIVLSPGRTCGALEITALLNRLGAPPVVVGEMQTIIHTCRKDSDSSVMILTCKNNVKVSALDPTHTQDIFAVIPACLQSFLTPARNTLETSIGNVGMILHCAPVLFNIGWIETPRTQFQYYFEGITPTVAGFLEKLDAERVAIASACGVEAPSVAQWLRDSYGVTGGTLYECVQRNKGYERIDAPKTLRHRYLFEDIPTGLVPLEAIGRAIQVPTAITGAIIDLASLLLDHDFRECGRNAKALGLIPELSREDVLGLLSGSPQTTNTHNLLFTEC
jgi:opine dehydrogenase